MKDIQTREIKANDLKIRELDNGKKVIEGVIPYNQRSEWMGFYEYIAPTAFKKTLQDGADVRALWNHDTTKLLGRVKNNSLRLTSDDYGLHIECDLPDTQYARDVYNLIKDGYNNGLSFGFTIINDKWEEREDENGNRYAVCYLLEVRLFEVSFCVSFPAYEGTNSEARNIRSIIDDIKKIKMDDLSEEEREAFRNIVKEKMPENAEPAPVEDTSAAESTDAASDHERQLSDFLAELKGESNGR